jgi:hypothetical protein
VLERVFDPAIPNRFSAHPDIAPDIHGPIDFAGAMNPANVFLFGEHGGFIYEWKGPQTYEVHVFITGEGRGRWAFAAARQSVAMMRELGATHLWARINRPEVKILAIKSGFRFAGTHELDAGQGPVVWQIYNWRT